MAIVRKSWWEIDQEVGDEVLRVLVEYRKSDQENAPPTFPIDAIWKETPVDVVVRGEIEQLRKDAKWMASKIDQLETALRSADCPGGGWTGQPKEIVVATVDDCLKHDVCGCSFGDALRIEATP